MGSPRGVYNRKKRQAINPDYKHAILGVSIAVAKVVAKTLNIPLYSYLGGTSAKILRLQMLAKSK